VYRYNGLGYRIQWQYDENIDFTLSSSERFYFLYDDRWRIVATFRDTDSSAKESFVYHAAGVAGRGGSSYIDSVILRDKDANTGWTSSGDGTLEERLYYCQNWRADVVALTKSDGQPTEFIRYTSYGTAQAFAAADVNRDGVVNSTDAADWDELYTDSGLGNAAIPVDFDFDGSSFNPDDLDAFTDAYSEASGWTNGGLGAGGGKLSRIGNRKGYAGYEYDHSVVAYHVRHRVYVPEIGRWTKRDPLGYVDGMGLQGYVRQRVVLTADPSGLRPPGMTIDNGCSRDLQFCAAWDDTVIRLINQITSSGCSLPSVTCNERGSTGYFDCNTGSISLPSGAGCALLRHELSHAAYNCESGGGRNEDGSGCATPHGWPWSPEAPVDWNRFCQDAACDEIQAYVNSGTCCVRENREPGEDYCGCIRRRSAWSIRQFHPACKAPSVHINSVFAACINRGVSLCPDQHALCLRHW
jgi:RHS repeat-associated protein